MAINWDDLDKEAGINYSDLDNEAGIAPVPTASKMLKDETVRTQAAVEEVQTEDPRQKEIDDAQRQNLMPRSLMRLPGRQARYAKVGRTENEQFKDELRTVRDTQDGPEQKAAKVRAITKQRLSEKAERFQEVIQSPYELQVMLDDAKELDTRGKKMSRRLDRGLVMLAGGGAHVLEELQSWAKDEVTFGEEAGNLARDMHKLINSPYMQPRVDDWVDKYLGGTVESGPYMAAGLAAAVVTRGKSIPALISGAMVAYGVEGNSIYQDNLDQGRSEKESRIRGMVGGSLSAGVEVLGGSGAKYFGKVQTKVVGKLARVKRMTRGIVVNALKEGIVEELPQEVIGMVMGGNPPRNADGSIDYDGIANQLFDAAAIGTFSGGFIDVSTRSITGANQNLKKRALMAEVKDMKAAEEAKAEAAKAEREAIVAEQTQVQEDHRSDTVDRKAQAVLEASAAKSLGMSVEQFREISPQMQQEAVKLVQPVQVENQEGTDMPTEVKTAHDAEAAQAVGMTLEEATELLTYTDKAGAVQTPKPGSISKARLLTSPLYAANKEGKLSPTQRLNRKGVMSFVDKIKRGVSTINDSFTTVERMLERLDNKEGGPLHTYFMGLRDTAYERKETTQVAVMNAEKALRDMGFKAEWMSDIMSIREGLELTTANKMGVAMLAKNDKGRRQVIEGMKLTEEEVDGMEASLTPEQQSIVSYMEDIYERQWEDITEAAMAAGMNPKDLLKEAWYSPIVRTDVDSSEQHNLVTMLTNQFTQESKMPDKKNLEKRKNTAGEIELDAISMFMQNIAMVEAFKAMAPLVADINKVTSDQKFVKGLNRATHGQGSRILNKWISDTVRGQSVDSAQTAAKISKHLRHKSMVYLLNHNIMISSKQWISVFQAMAADKGVGPAMIANMPAIMKNFKEVQAEVKGKSRMVRTRDFDREFQRKVDAESIKRTMEGKKRADENAVKWIKDIDNITVVLTWKSLYDVKMAKTKGDEAASVKYADKWVARTQPMGDAVDLPDFFRGGELAKVLTSFQRMPNQVWNLVAHDIVGATQRGDITKTEAGRRALVSIVIPALVFGLMRRGRPQKDWEELVEDMLLYPLGIVPLIGSAASAAVKGFSGQSFVGMLGFEELVKAARSAVGGKAKDTLLHGAKSVGAFTGKIGAQAMRTAEGIYDLATDETDDPRRLLYSEYALNDKDKSTSGSSSSRRPRRKSRPSRRK